MVLRFCCSYVDICVVLYGDYKFLGILSGFNALFPLESAQGSGHWCWSLVCVNRHCKKMGACFCQKTAEADSNFYKFGGWSLEKSATTRN